MAVTRARGFLPSQGSDNLEQCDEALKRLPNSGGGDTVFLQPSFGKRLCIYSAARPRVRRFNGFGKDAVDLARVRLVRFIRPASSVRKRVIKDARLGPDLACDETIGPP